MNKRLRWLTVFAVFVLGVIAPVRETFAQSDDATLILQPVAIQKGYPYKVAALYRAGNDMVLATIDRNDVVQKTILSQSMIFDAAVYENPATGEKDIYIAYFNYNNNNYELMIIRDFLVSQSVVQTIPFAPLTVPTELRDIRLELGTNALGEVMPVIAVLRSPSLSAISTVELAFHDNTSWMVFPQTWGVGVDGTQLEMTLIAQGSVTTSANIIFLGIVPGLASSLWTADYVLSSINNVPAIVNIDNENISTYSVSGESLVSKRWGTGEFLCSRRTNGQWLPQTPCYPASFAQLRMGNIREFGPTTLVPLRDNTHIYLHGLDMGNPFSNPVFTHVVANTSLTQYQGVFLNKGISNVRYIAAVERQGPVGIGFYNLVVYQQSPLIAAQYQVLALLEDHNMGSNPEDVSIFGLE